MAVVLGICNHSSSKSGFDKLPSSAGGDSNEELVSAWAVGEREAKPGREKILYKRVRRIRREREENDWSVPKPCRSLMWTSPSGFRFPVAV